MTLTKRTFALVVALALALVSGACGGSTEVDERSTSSSSNTATAESANDRLAGGEADSGASEDAAEPPASSDSEDIEDFAQSAVVDSLIDALPDRCRDGLVDALQLMEPIVSGTDWETATVGQFEETANQIDELPDPFEGDPTCEDVSFDEALAMGVVNRIAVDEAPGTLGFLTVALSAFQLPDVSGASEPDCDAVFDTLTELAGSYPTVNELPMARFQELTPVMMSVSFCPGFDALLAESPEIEAFLNS